MKTVHDLGPESVLLRALAARDQLDFAEVVRLCELHSVQSFARSYLTLVAPVTLEDVRAEDPSLTDPESQLVFQRRRDLVKYRTSRLRDALGVETYDELVALDALEFARRWLERGDRRWSDIKRIRAKNRPVPAELEELPEGLKYEIIELDQLSSDSVRVAFQRVWRTDGKESKTSVQHEELTLQNTVEWRIRFRARLLQPEGQFVEYASPAVLEALREDFGP